jgi:predicted XRE-type DNA-binding protein
LSQNQLARLLHSSQSRVATMEGGDPTVSIDLLVVAVCVDDDRIDQRIEAA